LRTARAWGATPTEFFKNWTGRDRALAGALQYYEAHTNPETGLPDWIDQDPLRDFRVEAQISHASKALAKERQRYADNKTPMEGISFIVIDNGTPEEVRAS